MLIAEDRTSLAGSLGKFLYGLAWCLGVGFLLATVLWFAIDGLSWIAWFGIYLAILIPILLVHEMRSRKTYVVASLNEEPDSGSMVTAEKNQIISLLTWGPRQLLDGLAALRGKRSSDFNTRFKRAAQAVVDLGKYSGGIEVKAIMHPPENMPVFLSALDWLDKHDYIGRSSDGERLWLSSIARKKLTESGITIKITSI